MKIQLLNTAILVALAVFSVWNVFGEKVEVRFSCKEIINEVKR